MRLASQAAYAIQKAWVDGSVTHATRLKRGRRSMVAVPRKEANVYES